MDDRQPFPRSLMIANALQAIALVVLFVLMVMASTRSANAYLWAQIAPVGLLTAITVGLSLWANSATTNAAWITGLVAHLIALPLYGAWVFFWTFVFGMERGNGDFVDNSVLFGILYGLALLVIALLFLGAKPDRQSSSAAENR